ncbi:FecR family protein [Solemya velum gill symbiont]|nr:FecR family protein [Solemya velum gill symbiont]OOY40325.1 hypothetical protein BOV90_04415 [Solemya velum gill symbiont]OOY46537.1 hypothetical protein BOV93_09540 [Solemya velum gill symbiont]OOY47225.1 hypothetical protein BOV92_01695 [Solemya velum gill symbiont]OOY52843.1 hypothetical protein BOV97_03590 [Solemya velum gill symbiont]OOY57961.1 hypothetical protein BOW00_03715 [Solemya velum gill symbiont]
MKPNTTIKLSALLVSCIFSGISVADAEKAGITLLAKGNVTATAGQDIRKLKRRSAIHESEVLETGNESRAQFRMQDGAVIALQENSSLSLLEYQYKQPGSDDSVIMKLTKGGLRTISGAVGKDDPKDYRLETPLATIGIKGTVYEAELAGDNLFVAFWKGRGKVTAPGCDASLGDGHPFRIVRVSAAGECELLEFDGGRSPFSAGHSMDPTTGPDDDPLNLDSFGPTSGDPDSGLPFFPNEVLDSGGGIY